MKIQLLHTIGPYKICYYPKKTLLYNFFIDNGLYKNLVKTDREESWNLFYDSLIARAPQYKDIDYEIIFSSFSVLEAIGLGKQFKTDGKKKFSKPSIASELEAKEAPYIIFKAAFEFYNNHASISQKSLADQIKEQINNYSKSEATTELVAKTLGNYNRFLKKCPKKALRIIVESLAWDTACSFNYFELNEASIKARTNAETRIKILYSTLFSIWLEQRRRKVELCSYRITDRINIDASYIPTYRNSVSLETNIAKINSIKFLAELDPGHDLVDADLIHFVTLGKYDHKRKKYIPVVAFTCDSKEVIKDRITLQLNTLRKMFNGTPYLQSLIVPGIIYFANESCEIIDDALYVKDLLDHTRVQVQITSN